MELANKEQKEMNKKGISNITIIFWVLTFGILWALVFANLVSTWGHAAVIAGSMTGIEALLYDNINAIVFVILGIFILALGLGGGGQNG